VTLPSVGDGQFKDAGSIVGDCRFVDHDNRPEADTAKKFKQFAVVVLQLSSELVKPQFLA
jgi:hypothetical protein